MTGEDFWEFQKNVILSESEKAFLGELHNK